METSEIKSSSDINRVSVGMFSSFEDDETTIIISDESESENDTKTINHRIDTSNKNELEAGISDTINKINTTASGFDDSKVQISESTINHRSHLIRESIPSLKYIITSSVDDDELHQIVSSQIDSKTKNGHFQQVTNKSRTTATSNNTKNTIRVTESSKNSTTNHRSRLRNDSTSSESEASDLNSDEEDAPLIPKVKFQSDYTTVTQAVYDEHAAEIKTISDKIMQNQLLLKFSSQLPDRGGKLKHLLMQLNDDLAYKQNIMKNLKVTETVDLTYKFKGMSVKEQLTASVMTDCTVRDDWKNNWNGLFREYQSTSTTDSVSQRIVNLLNNLQQSLQTMPSECVLADQPKLINVSLMRHQKQGLAWMEWREKQFPRGGILGDDMGLGKTLSMISLIARQIEARKVKSQQQQKDKSSQMVDRNTQPEYNGRTLIVCPASLIKQWESEINKFACFVGVMLHHGDKRSTSASELASSEIVITTYGIVKIEFEKAGPITKIMWERIILDEAHILKNHTSKQSKDCCRLNGSIKWCITGTPIQNKEQDVFSLLKFVDCAPLDDYTTFKKFTATKTKKRLALILNFILLRRTKHELQKNGEMLALPMKSSEIIQVKLDDDEMNVYKMVLVFSQTLFRKFLDDRQKKDSDILFDEKQNHSRNRYLQRLFNMPLDTGSVSACHICLVLLRLRQICIHPHLIDAMLSAEDLKITSDPSALESTVLERLVELKIGEGNDDDENVGTILSRSNPVFNPDRSSSKFKVVLKLIQERVINTGEKAVVVSQFTSVLQLFKKHLSDQGITYSMLTGSTKIAHRTDIVNAFNDDSNKQVLLLSLTAGGVGLNLCGGNHLFLIDPHWNPQLENQAEDRIYRIGQTKPVTIYRFICQGTIEQRIEDLQALKREIAKSVLDDNGKSSEMKLTVDDMWYLISEN